MKDAASSIIDICIQLTLLIMSEMIQKEQLRYSKIRCTVREQSSEGVHVSLVIGV
jgi:hypothetical protein